MKEKNDFDYSELNCYVVKTKDGVMFKHLKQEPTASEFFTLSKLVNFYHERIYYYLGLWYMQCINKYNERLIRELEEMWLTIANEIAENKTWKRYVPFFEDIVLYIYGKEDIEKAEELTQLFGDYAYEKNLFYHILENL